MWQVKIIIFLSATLIACSAMYPEEIPEEFGRAEQFIELGRSTKAQVLDALGRPEWEDPKDGSLYYSGEVAGKTACGLMRDPQYPTVSLPGCVTRPKDWWMKVVFDARNIVQSVETKTDLDAALARDEVRKEQRVFELESLALAGDLAAALTLVKEYGELDSLKTLAANGDSAAQYEVYRDLERRRVESTDAWAWLCMAANRGHAIAQWQVGYMQAEARWNYLATTDTRLIDWLQEAGIVPDDRVSYMWYRLAAASGDPDVTYHLEHLAGGMSENQMAQAEQMFRDWKPGDCPSAEHRLGVPGS